MGAAVNRYGLIQADEKVLVALSGGKDSLVLLDTLVSRISHLPVSYELWAVHVTVENFPVRADVDYLREFCFERKVPLHLRSVSVDRDVDEGKSPCFICSRHRRKALFDTVKELGCKRLALGHHMDDILETLLLSMTMNGRISAMPVRLSMFNGEFDIIRPLALLGEKEIERYSRIKNFKTDGTRCPLGDSTMRTGVRRVLSEIEKLNGKARKNMFAAMGNIDRQYLP